MYILSNIKKLYDGTSSNESSIHQGVDVIIDNGLIHTIAAHDPNKKYPEATIIDCSNYIVTPGLIDCHLHITVVDFNTDKMNSQAEILYIEKNLYKTLVYGGVTTARDMGGATHYIKRLLAGEVVLGPRLKTSVSIFCPTGGHADFRKPDCFYHQPPIILPPEPGRPSCIVDGPEQCRKRVREVIGCGADLIKICTSGGVVSPTDRIEDRPFTDEEIAAFVDEANAHGKFVASHAESPIGISMAIEHGVHFLEHATFMNDELAQAAKKAQCVVTPTTWTFHILAEHPTLSSLVQKKGKEALDAMHEAVQCMLKYELPLLMGSDAGMSFMHGQNYMELVHMVKEGIPPLTAWYGATGLAAENVDEPQTGTIVAGQFADLLLFEQDVIAQPELWNKDTLFEVIKDGYAYRGKLKELPQKSFLDTLTNTLEN